MILGVVALVMGLVVLTKAADEFVEGAVALAYHYRMSTVVVGAVIIGFGTSAPEMLVSAFAAAGGDVDIGIGNVAGSNIANLTLVLGATAAITTIPIGRETVLREGPMSFAAVVLFAFAVQDGVSFGEAGLLALGLSVAIGAAVLGARTTGGEPQDPDRFMVRTEVARTGAGLVFTVVGAQAVVVGATRIADALDLAGGFVGLTIVAVGTSLPELATALTAARRGETDLVIGNLLGSNIFNSLAVGGIIGFVGPGVVQDEALTGTPMWMMVGVSAAVLVVIVTGRRVVRWEGILLLAAFIAFLLFLPR